MFVIILRAKTEEKGGNVPRGVPRGLHYSYVTVADQSKQMYPQIRLLGGGGTNNNTSRVELFA